MARNEAPGAVAGLSDLERQIVNALQQGIPIASRPFRSLAERLGVEEERIVEVIDNLLHAGLATRFGPMFDVEKMGGKFCLCAVAAGDQWPKIADMINRVEAVAHNYLRDHTFNLWFVVAAESQAHLEATLASLETQIGLPILALPKLKEYAIGLYLEV